VMELADALRDTAQRSGVLRAVAFATALRGETAYLMGDLELARAELSEAVELHRDIGSAAGEAHSLQRLAEVELESGRRAQAAVGLDDQCEFCSIMLAVPSAKACAAVGDLDDARRQLAVAERSARRWEGTSWQAALLEVRSHIAAAEGDRVPARRLLEQAAELFEASGQPLHARRCRA